MAPDMTVLGISVTEEQVERWLGYYCPGRQPFRVASLVKDVVDELPTTASLELTNELRDTFFTYGGGRWIWLSEAEFADLPAGARAALGAERRRRVRPKPVPAWPGDPMIRAKLIRWMEAGTRPSLHAFAQSQLSQAATGPLPRAIELAGTFPAVSGPNCFGAVMAATGESVDDVWVQLDQFQAWLAASTRPTTGRDVDVGGQVLVWHQDAELAHAAVTLPGGWALQKPSQAWSSPTGVWTTEEVIRSWSIPGVRLSRHVLT